MTLENTVNRLTYHYPTNEPKKKKKNIYYSSIDSL